MIENLTYHSFAPYGRLHSEKDFSPANFGFVFIKQREIFSKRVEGLFINRHTETLVDIFDGPAILYIGDSPDSLKTFLLDYPVVINKNIYYCVVPLLDRAIISVSADNNWPQYIEIPPQDRPVGIVSEINIDKIYTLLYHEKELGFSFKGEAHEMWELTYADTGVVYNEVDGKKYCLSPGDIMIFAPNSFHKQYSDEFTAVRYLTVSFKMDFAEKEIFDGLLFHSSGEIKRLMEKIITEKENHTMYSDDLILCYLEEVIIHLLRMKKLEGLIKKADTRAKDRIENEICRRVTEYVRKNISKKISVAKIAASIPVNASYLSTLFKNCTGETLIEYITKQKLERAKDYIRTGRYTFTQIAEMLSFTGVHYFSKQFKKVYGITPSEYAGSIKK